MASLSYDKLSSARNNCLPKHAKLLRLLAYDFNEVPGSHWQACRDRHKPAASGILPAVIALASSRAAVYLLSAGITLHSEKVPIIIICAQAKSQRRTLQPDIYISRAELLHDTQFWCTTDQAFLVSDKRNPSETMNVSVMDTCQTNAHLTYTRNRWTFPGNARDQ